ncbi:MAG: hypothetical protein COA76_16890 [Moritella sp.]|uniref:hypothetical protein n=1 Tax=Moritella sp. PE36 TaxID=58051 RepID=UPI0001569126|nr:hypothetical protein [Moritella sp. PE36]EDM66814.1 hypothetical protein PE36_13212 [Moritella sp. PE36]PHR85990.1 MAG: hypothetical protein COA76_16890 [Moritella sp.]
MEVENIQQEIKILLTKLDWSIPKLAEVIYVEKFDDDEAEDEVSAVKTFESKLKKQLSRKTTKTKLLEEYLIIISNHNDFSKLGLAIPYYVESKTLSATMEDGMRKISKLVTEMCIE